MHNVALQSKTDRKYYSLHRFPDRYVGNMNSVPKDIPVDDGILFGSSSVLMSYDLSPKLMQIINRDYDKIKQFYDYCKIFTSNLLGYSSDDGNDYSVYSHSLITSKIKVKPSQLVSFEFPRIDTLGYEMDMKNSLYSKLGMRYVLENTEGRNSIMVILSPRGRSGYVLSRDTGRDLTTGEYRAYLNETKSNLYPYLRELDNSHLTPYVKSIWEEDRYDIHKFIYSMCITAVMDCYPKKVSDRLLNTYRVVSNFLTDVYASDNNGNIKSNYILSPPGLDSSTIQYIRDGEQNIEITDDELMDIYFNTRNGEFRLKKIANHTDEIKDMIECEVMSPVKNDIPKSVGVSAWYTFSKEYLEGIPEYNGINVYHVDIKSAYGNSYTEVTGKTLPEYCSTKLEANMYVGKLAFKDIYTYQKIRLKVTETSNNITSILGPALYWRVDGGLVICNDPNKVPYVSEMFKCVCTLYTGSVPIEYLKKSEVPLTEEAAFLVNDNTIIPRHITKDTIDRYLMDVYGYSKLHISKLTLEDKLRLSIDMSKYPGCVISTGD